MHGKHQLWTGVHLLTLTDNGNPCGLLKHAAITAKDGQITWLGEATQVPEQDYEEVLDCAGRYLSPGFIDCHTHLVYGGDRVGEFEQRLSGVAYEDIALRGGGILSTVAQTRSESEAELMKSAEGRLAHLMADGVTTIEIKSGYGLDTDTELKMLRVIRELDRCLPIDIIATFLGAHTVPAEFKDDADGYIEQVCKQMIPQVASEKLAQAVDAFCENIAFTPAQVRRVFETAKQHGLALKLHADQLSDSGGAALAAEYGALSADHLEHTNESAIRAMAENGTVAVLLPGAFYTLGETRLPPLALLREHGVPLAIATDCNPGSSPVLSLQLVLNMACTLFKLTPEEALRAVTRNAALALGLGHDRGTLETGKRADFALWDINHPAELCYYAGGNRCHATYSGGVRVPR